LGASLSDTAGAHDRGFSGWRGTDIVARIIAPWLSERLGQPIIIENRPGAATNIAIQAAVNSPPDGYTLLFLTASGIVNASFSTIFRSMFCAISRPCAGWSTSRW